MLRKTLFAFTLLAACGGPKAPDTIPAPPPSGSDTPDPIAKPLPMPPQSPDEALIAEAKQFIADTDKEYRRVAVASSQAEWTNLTDLTPAHEEVAAKASAELSKFLTKSIKAARKFEPVLAKLDASTRRQFELLRFAGQPAPDDPAQADQLAKIGAEMSSIYGKGKACVKLSPRVKPPAAVKLPPPTGYQCGAGTTKPNIGCACPKGQIEGRDAEKNATCVTAPPPPPPGTLCLGIDELSAVLQKSRDQNELLAVWTGWHDNVGRAERDLFSKFVPLANAGAKGAGFRDVSDMWKSGYDMPADAFEAETDRLWGQMKPLYDQLHCYTRRKLTKMYGEKVQPKTGPIKAHLTGNMWAQSWTWLYKELEPYPGQASINVTPTIEKTLDSKKMVKVSEAFYTSLGFPELPATFWERSMFDKPAGKEVVCHASAWDVTFSNDLRIKMCIQKTQEELEVIHHELGHNYYFAAYYNLPMLFQNGANDGFHEAIGDTIVLSMTPAYYKERGLLKEVAKNEKATINQQMQAALERIAFVPFGLVVDKWRWDVYAGKVTPDKYNEHWWNLRAKYQGVVPPTARAATDFDPGAKYHVPANVAYTRYFLARVLQFQFHRALCKKAGHTGPLHECSIYKNKEAGAAFWKTLQAGASKPWQETLFELTGSRDMDATAILEYFAPLKTWLEQQNKGQTCSW